MGAIQHINPTKKERYRAQSISTTPGQRKENESISLLIGILEPLQVT